jgi:tripartite-type tricarboxylate transporter receptor subunit TctC
LTTGLLAAALSLAAHAAIAADDYPNRAIRVLVPYAAGGSSDTGARLIQEPMSKRLGQTLVVDNRGGAGGLIGTEQYLKEAADGYTILLGAIGPFAVIPGGKKVSYDVEKDFTPLGFVWNSAQVLAVHPRVPAKTLAEFIDYARKNPGKVSIGSSGFGSISHLTIELFKREAGIDIIHVPFRSTGASLPGLLSGSVDAMVGDAVVVAPQIEAGMIKALAVASPERSIALPDTPTMKESGLPGAIAESWFGFVVHSKTPAPIVEKLRSAMLAAQKDPAYLEAVRKQKANGGAPGWQPYAETIKRDADKWKRVMKEANITID